MADKNKEGIPKKKSLAKMPHLVAPVNALDEKTTRTLYANQETILGYLMEFTKQVVTLKRNMRKIIIEEVEKEIGDKIKMIDALYKRTIVIQNIWFKKGLITREEISKEYEEVKKK